MTRADGEKALEGSTPGGYRRPVSFGIPVAARTRRGNKALKAAASVSSPSGGGSAGNVRRARTPRGAPLAHEGNTLKGQAHGRSGASRAGRIGGVRREGGSQTPHAARGGEGIRRLHAGPPVRDCVVGHQSPGEAASRDCHPRRFCNRNRWLALRCGAAGTRLQGRTKAHGGPIPGSRAGRKLEG
jgi:hypothetical protein